MLYKCLKLKENIYITLPDREIPISPDSWQVFSAGPSEMWSP